MMWNIKNFLNILEIDRKKKVFLNKDFLFWSLYDKIRKRKL